MKTHTHPDTDTLRTHSSDALTCVVSYAFSTDDVNNEGATSSCQTTEIGTHTHTHKYTQIRSAVPKILVKSHLTDETSAV